MNTNAKEAWKNFKQAASSGRDIDQERARDILIQEARKSTKNWPAAAINATRAANGKPLDAAYAVRGCGL